MKWWQYWKKLLSFITISDCIFPIIFFLFLCSSVSRCSSVSCYFMKHPQSIDIDHRFDCDFILTSCILALLAFLQNERRKIKSHSLLRSVSSYQLYVCSKAYQIHVYLFIFSSIYICFSIRQNDKFLFSFCLSSIEDSRIQEVNEINYIDSKYYLDILTL